MQSSIIVRQQNAGETEATADFETPDYHHGRCHIACVTYAKGSLACVNARLATVRESWGRTIKGGGKPLSVFGNVSMNMDQAVVGRRLHATHIRVCRCVAMCSNVTSA